jgi:hypothetical protein
MQRHILSLSVVTALALLGVASSAVAAPKHHARDVRGHNIQVLRDAAYARDLRLYSAPARDFNAVREPAGYAGYADKWCTSCNLGSY